MSFAFGQILSLDPTITLTAFGVTVVFLGVADFCTSTLENFFERSHVHTRMLQKMYKELMMMGLVGFINAMYQASNYGTISEEWLYTFDYVGYILFFNTLFFVGHAICIIIWSLKTSGDCMKYHNMSVLDVSNQIAALSDAKGTFGLRVLLNISYNPFSSIRAMGEFKITHVLFRDTYGIPSDFNFGSYVSLSFEKYALKVINIGFSWWLTMGILASLNYLRITYGKSNVSFKCDFNSGEQVDESCYRTHLNLFIVALVLLVIYVTSLLLITRQYTLRLLLAAGVEDVDSLDEFLIYEATLEMQARAEQLKSQREEEKTSTRRRKINFEDGGSSTGSSPIKATEEAKDNQEHLNSVPSSPTKNDIILINQSRQRKWKPRMSNATFKHNIEKIKLKMAQEKELQTPALRMPSTDERGILNIFMSGTKSQDNLLKKHPNMSKVTVHPSTSLSGVSHIKEPPRGNSEMPEESEGSVDHVVESFGHLNDVEIYPEGTQETNSRKRLVTVIRDIPAIADREQSVRRRRSSVAEFRNRRATRLSQRRKSNISIGEQGPGTTKTTVGSGESGTGDATGGSSMFRRAVSEKNNDTLGGSTMKLEEDFSAIYFFGSPAVYFRAVEIGIILNSLFMTLWVTNFITIARHSDSVVMYQLLMLIPVLVLLPCLVKVVKEASILSAVAALDVDVIGEVLEESEDKKNLIDELRAKVSRRIQGSDLTQSELVALLFSEIDVDNSGKISRREFEEMLVTMDMVYSNKKFKRLYNSIDRNSDGSISLDELEYILFPPSAEHRALKDDAAVAFNKRHNVHKSGSGLNDPLRSKEACEQLQKSIDRRLNRLQQSSRKMLIRNDKTYRDIRSALSSRRSPVAVTDREESSSSDVEANMTSLPQDMNRRRILEKISTLKNLRSVMVHVTSVRGQSAFDGDGADGADGQDEFEDIENLEDIADGSLQASSYLTPRGGQDAQCLHPQKEHVQVSYGGNKDSGAICEQHEDSIRDVTEDNVPSLINETSFSDALVRKEHSSPSNGSGNGSGSGISGKKNVVDGSSEIPVDSSGAQSTCTSGRQEKYMLSSQETSNVVVYGAVESDDES